MDDKKTFQFDEEEILILQACLGASIHDLADVVKNNLVQGRENPLAVFESIRIRHHLLEVLGR